MQLSGEGPCILTHLPDSANKNRHLDRTGKMGWGEGGEGFAMCGMGGKPQEWSRNARKPGCLAWARHTVDALG